MKTSMLLQKTFAFAIVLFILNHFAIAQNATKLNLHVSNVCEYYGQFIFCNGTDSSGISSSFGSAGCVYNSTYTHIDSTSVLNKIKHVEMDESNAFNTTPKLFYLSDGEKVISYYTHFLNFSICDPIIVSGDTLFTDSINDFKIDYNSLVMIRNTNQLGNLIVYDTASFDTLLILNLNMVPKFMDVQFGFAAIAGIDSNNDWILNVIELSSGLLVEFGTYGPLANNPVSLKYGSQKIYLVSQPGDSAIYMNTYNFTGNAITSTGIYSSSGVNTYAWLGHIFHYQPEADLSGNNLDSQVLQYNAALSQQGNSFSINKRLHQLSYGGVDGTYPFVHAVEESIYNNKVYVYSHFNYSLADSFITAIATQVDFVKSDFRCFVSLEEYDDNLVKLVVYPNPVNEIITIKASGLICGRDYKMDIVDLSGKVWYAQTIQAKMSFEIPLEALPSGIYIFRIHTKKGFVTERVVKG